MSEKHLTELGWTNLLKTSKFSDKTLLKALQVYSNLEPRKEPQKAIEALDEINETAAKIKKSKPEAAGVADYVDEVLAEVIKTKKLLATLAKSAEAAAQKENEPKTEPKDAADEPESTVLKDRLINSLNKVKAAAEKEAFAFVACVAKPFYGVLLGKTSSERIGAPHKKELTELTKGTKFYEGTCIFEKEAHTFVLDSVPGGLAKNLKSALKEYTEKAYKIRVRDLEGKVIADGDTEQDVEDKNEGSDPQKKKQETELRQRIEGLRKQPVDGPYEQLKTQALAKADEFVKMGRFPDATVLLDQYVKKVAVPITPRPPIAPTPETTKAPSSEPKLSTYLNAVPQWKDARTAAANGIFKLKTAILKECDPELKKAVEAKINEINGILTVMDDAMISKIQDAGSANPDKQAQCNREVVKFADTLLGGLSKHRLADVVDKNPFGTFAIREPMEKMLNKLRSDFGI